MFLVGLETHVFGYLQVLLRLAVESSFSLFADRTLLCANDERQFIKVRDRNTPSLLLVSLIGINLNRVVEVHSTFVSARN